MKKIQVAVTQKSDKNVEFVGDSSLLVTIGEDTINTNTTAEIIRASLQLEEVLDVEVKTYSNTTQVTNIVTITSKNKNEKEFRYKPTIFKKGLISSSASMEDIDSQFKEVVAFIKEVEEWNKAMEELTVTRVLEFE